MVVGIPLLVDRVRVQIVRRLPMQFVIQLVHQVVRVVSQNVLVGDAPKVMLMLFVSMELVIVNLVLFQ